MVPRMCLNNSTYATVNFLKDFVKLTFNEKIDIFTTSLFFFYYLVRKFATIVEALLLKIGTRSANIPRSSHEANRSKR